MIEMIWYDDSVEYAITFLLLQSCYEMPQQRCYLQARKEGKRERERERERERDERGIFQFYVIHYNN
jgi:hypothetical protein